MDFQALGKKLDREEPLTKEDALELLAVDARSETFYTLLALANELSRREYAGRGYVFAQVGLNAEPCTGGCRFCSLAEGHFCVDGTYRLTEEEAVAAGLSACIPGVSDLFLMTTADYPQEAFVRIGAAVRKKMPEGMRLVANIGDFTPERARELKAAGFTGVYHIRRLREGEDTCLPPRQRLDTLDAAKAAGLELYYCVEPIGPEHTHEELADEMLRARDYGVDRMAVMRRTPVPGTPLEKAGTISRLELTKIAAVARLVTRPRWSMNVHEPTEMALLAGVNQLYAEYGANPRDVLGDTASGRGFSIEKVRDMLENAGYTVG